MQATWEQVQNRLSPKKLLWAQQLWLGKTPKGKGTIASYFYIPHMPPLSPYAMLH